MITAGCFFQLTNTLNLYKNCFIKRQRRGAMKAVAESTAVAGSLGKSSSCLFFRFDIFLPFSLS